MVQVKLLITPQELENQNRLYRYKELIVDLNTFLGTPIQITHKKDPNFQGYYLFFESNYLPDVNYKLIDQKTFLIGVNHANDDVIKDCNPAGYIAYRNYMAKFPMLFGLNEVFDYEGIDTNGLKYFDYSSIVIYEKDDSYRPMVKTIFKYLEIYNKYLKDQKK